MNEFTFDLDEVIFNVTETDNVEDEATKYLVTAPEISEGKDVDVKEVFIIKTENILEELKQAIKQVYPELFSYVGAPN